MNLKTGIAVIDIEIKSLKLLKKNLSKNFNQAVELLYNTKGKIIVSGIGKSGHIASKISSDFLSYSSFALRYFLITLSDSFILELSSFLKSSGIIGE